MFVPRWAMNTYDETFFSVQLFSCLANDNVKIITKMEDF